MPHGPALRAAVEALGADRLLRGTDFPYEYGPLFQKALDPISQSGLTTAGTRDASWTPTPRRCSRADRSNDAPPGCKLTCRSQRFERPPIAGQSAFRPASPVHSISLAEARSKPQRPQPARGPLTPYVLMAARHSRPPARGGTMPTQDDVIYFVVPRLDLPSATPERHSGRHRPRKRVAVC
jgi:hypothetical protein